MTKATDMVDRLRQSVAEIIASEAGNKEELLAKSFDEFQDALAEAEEIESEELEMEDDEDVDPVVAFADAIANADEIAAMLIDSGQVDEQTAHIFDQLAMVSDLSLRCLANTRALPVEEEEYDELEAMKSDGISVHEMPLAKNYEDEPDSILVKTDLPPEVAQFITDPAEIEEAMAAIGMEMAEAAGVDFGSLAKAAPMAEGEMAPPGGDFANQLQVLMRLNAAALVQGEQIMQALSGGMPEGHDDDQNEDVEAAADDIDSQEDGYEDEEDDMPPQRAAPEDDGGEPVEEDDEQKKNPFAKSESSEDLRKALAADFASAVKDATGPLQKALEDARTEIDRLKKQPSAPKAVLGPIAKSVDNGGNMEDTAEKLAKMSETDRAVELMKMAHQSPIRM
jgi:hypothetical protein